MVRLVDQVMWYPRATSPYMLPRARPVTTSWRKMGASPYFMLTGTILPPFQTTMT
jgi:hypothetical protein